MKYLVAFFAFLLVFTGCYAQKEKDYSFLYNKESKYDVAGKSPSPFVGKWRWVYDKPGVTNISVNIGERNDSLFVAFYCIYDYGSYIGGPMSDRNNKTQADVCIALPKSGNTVKGVNVYKPFDYMPAPFDSVFLRLIDKNTLVIKVGGGDNFYVPRQAAFKREHNRNIEFSPIVEYIYADSATLKK